MHRRADVVHETRQRQFRRACAATDLVRCFEHEHRATSFREAQRQPSDRSGRTPPRWRRTSSSSHRVGRFARLRAGSSYLREQHRRRCPRRPASPARSRRPRCRCAQGRDGTAARGRRRTRLANADGVVGGGVAVVKLATAARWRCTGHRGSTGRRRGTAPSQPRGRGRSLGPGSARARRTVVGEVGEAAPRVADPVAHRAAALVRDLAGQHGESLDGVLTLLDRVERPRAVELRRERPGTQAGS